MIDLAGLMEAWGRVPEAAALYAEGYALVDALDPADPGREWAAWKYSEFLIAVGRDADAEPVLRSRLNASRRTRGDEHSGTLVLARKYAELLQRRGDAAAAIALWRDLATSNRALLGDEHAAARECAALLAAALKARGRCEEGAEGGPMRPAAPGHTLDAPPAVAAAAATAGATASTA
jgi:hypothetical protein